ncbi:MAG: amidohydrolase family protein [Pirellulaceae bacterium]|nr:amidohydrolase family protein [Pirellulaceae bacterium]
MLAQGLCHRSVEAAPTIEVGQGDVPADEIWDLHGHLAGGVGQSPKTRMQHLLHVADRMGVAKLCVYMGMSFAYDPTPEQLIQQNNEVLEALSVAGDRALGFVYLNPKYVEESLQELERCVAKGPMVGVKLWVAMHADAAQLDPLLRRATELKAVVFQHTWIKVTGNLSGESTPMDLAVLAARHPEARLICGHAGGDWEQGIRAIRASPHVAIDLGGGEPTAGFTEMAARELGAERIIYGSDVPGRGFGTQLAKVYGAGLSDADRRLVLAGNLKRMLTPILQDKGWRV